jgi:gluconate kinase
MAVICTLRENVEKMNGGAPLTNERMTWFHRSRTAGSAADGNACRGAIDISP